MTTIDLLQWLHILGATVLLGTGAGIAFFMVAANRTRDVAIVAHVAGTVVIADIVFTATAVVAQPITGALLANAVGWPMREGWILVSLALYVITGLFWIPVVWIQIRLRNLARKAAERRQPLPDQYDRLYRIWFACGFPAFFSALAILWLMVARPAIHLP